MMGRRYSTRLPASADLAERLLAKTDRAPGGCWEWVAARDARGYGMATRNGKTDRAHRLMYELLVGPIPDGLHIDHLCRNVSCVNPAHLEPVTCQVNTLRGIGIAAVNATKTHCNYGHLFDAANTYLQMTGGTARRVCRACKRRHIAEHRARMAA